MGTHGPRSSVLGHDDAAARVRAAQARGERVVLCHGCFDIVHPGHVRHLQHARSLGDRLVVSVSGDRIVGGKGPGRPLIPQELRAENLAALDCVDWVVVSEYPTGVEMLEHLRPDVYVKGAEYEQNRDPRFEAEKAVVNGYGGRVVFTSGDVVFSSTALIRAIEHEADPVTTACRTILDEQGLEARDLEQVVDAMRGRRVAVIGETVLDTYVACDRPDVSGEGPMLSLRPIERRSFDGGAAIVARHAAALGAKPILVTALPATPDAEAMRLRLEVEGVEVRAVPVTHPIFEKQRFLVGTQKVVKLDLGEPLLLDDTGRRSLLALAAGAADDADAAIVADFGLGLFGPALLESLCASLRRRVRILSGDVSGRRSSLLSLQGADLLTPSESELRDALHDHGGGMSAAVDRLLRRTGARAALVTLGPDGLVAFEQPTWTAGLTDRPTPVAADGGTGDDDGQWTTRLRATHVPSFAAWAVDPLGCGDALLASATLALASGGSLPAAALLGAIAAGEQASRLGNQVIGASELRRGVGRIAGARLAWDPSAGEQRRPVASGGAER